jgi:plastocyanin
LGGGKTYMHTFASGTLTYHCSIHPFMKGSVEVK